MKMTKSVIYICMTLFLMSCSSQRSVRTDYNEKIASVTGQSVTIGPDDSLVRIKVNDVQDNRCPKGVQCVWEGYVNVGFELSSPGKERTAFALCLGSCENINKVSKLNVVLGVKTYRVTLFEVEENKTVVFSVERI